MKIMNQYLRTLRVVALMLTCFSTVLVGKGYGQVLYRELSADDIVITNLPPASTNVYVSFGATTSGNLAPINSINNTLGASIFTIAGTSGSLGISLENGRVPDTVNIMLAYSLTNRDEIAVTFRIYEMDGTSSQIGDPVNILPPTRAAGMLETTLEISQTIKDALANYLANCCKPRVVQLVFTRSTTNGGTLGVSWTRLTYLE